MAKSKRWQWIPTNLSLTQFDQFVLPHLIIASRGPENPRGRKTIKHGRKQIFDDDIFEERFRTIERMFIWEDKFKRLLLRFDCISEVHYAATFHASARRDRSLVNRSNRDASECHHGYSNTAKTHANARRSAVGSAFQSVPSHDDECLDRALNVYVAATL